MGCGMEGHWQARKNKEWQTGVTLFLALQFASFPCSSPRPLQIFPLLPQGWASLGVCLDNQGSATYVGGVAWSGDSCGVKETSLMRMDSPRPTPLQWANPSEPNQGTPTRHCICRSWAALWRA